jgi:hypothetical protein
MRSDHSSHNNLTSNSNCRWHIQFHFRQAALHDGGLCSRVFDWGFRQQDGRVPFLRDGTKDREGRRRTVIDDVAGVLDGHAAFRVGAWRAGW